MPSERNYEIHDRNGAFIGEFRAVSPEAALVAMYRRSGYQESFVWLAGGEVVFANEADRDMLGGFDRWDVTELP